VCGIAGKLSLDGPVERALVAAMCDSIEHRGPDSQGVFTDEGVGLGVQRLRVIDLETGDQPIYNEDDSVVIVLNGEIYNYRELRAGLEQRGHRFKTQGDTEVIVHLYEELGERCVEPLRGMFAFALWDRRARRLLLARDRIGKKPLVYAQRGSTIWFASEPRAILADPEAPRGVNYDALDAFLEFSYVPDPLSAFAGLAKLPPAHTLTWDGMGGGTAEPRRYWRLDRSLPPETADEREWPTLVRERLLEATRLRLRSDVPVGAFLSGGVDSSAVVAAMAQSAEGRIRTFSIGFDVGAFDETPHAREVASMYGTEHEEIRIEPRAVEVLPKLVWHYGEPFADPSAVPSFYLAEATRRHVTVALSGDGGDESFAGYERYRVHEVAHRLRRLGAPGAALLTALGSPRSGLRPRRAAAWLGTSLRLPQEERYRHTMANFKGDFRERLYEPELLAAVGGPRGGAADRVIADAFRDATAESLTERLIEVDVATYLPGDLLVKMDIASMASSLEVRSPLLDHVLMETAARLPLSASLRGGESKRVFRDAVRDWLPEYVLRRAKMGFSVPVDDWLRGELRELPADVLLDPRATGRGLFRRAEVERLIVDHRDRSADNGLRIWALLQLELWFRTYVDAGQPAPLTLNVTP
jgi:asparagine synthase (glutamine-hydrolysing)